MFAYFSSVLCMITGGFTVFRGGCGSRVGAGLPGSVGCGDWLWRLGCWLAVGCSLDGLLWLVVCSPGSLIAGAGGWLLVWLPGSGWIAWLLPGSMFPWLLSRLAGGGDWMLPVLVGCCSLVPAGLFGSRFRGGWRVTAPSMVGRSRCDSPWFGWSVLILSIPARGSMFPWWLLVGGRSLAVGRWWRVLSCGWSDGGGCSLAGARWWCVFSPAVGLHGVGGSPVGGWLLAWLSVPGWLLFFSIPRWRFPVVGCCWFDDWRAVDCSLLAAG